MNEHTIPATTARGKFFTILEEIDKPNKTYTITLGGKPKAVILSFEEYENWVETLEILRDTKLLGEISEAKKEFEQDEYVSLEEILKDEKISCRSEKKSSKKSKKDR